MGVIDLDLGREFVRAGRTKLRADAERWRRILDTLPQMVWAMRPDLAEPFYNQQWIAFTGLDIMELDRAGRADLIHSDDREPAMSAWAECRRTGDPYEYEYRLHHHSGEHRWVISRARAERDERGDIVRWYGTITDIHDRKLAELRLAQSEALHRSVMDASVDCIMMIGLDGGFELMNGPGLQALEIEDFETHRGRNWVGLWPREARAAAGDAIELAKAGAAARFSAFCPTSKGTPKWWDVIVSPIKEDGGQVQSLLCIARDVTALRTTTEKLRRASEHDPLTNLPNRRSFGMRLDAAMLRAMASGSKLGLLLLDLDYFKHINDSLGHPAGDHLLRVIAERLRESVRGTDFVARLGGDEFAILLEDVADEDDLARIATAVLGRLQMPTHFDGRILTGAASIGAAVFPRDAGNAMELQRNADAALCAIKLEGRGGVKVYHQQMRRHAQNSSSQLSLARSVVQEATIVPFYQPKVTLPSGAIYGFEALLRWQHPRLGIQLPSTIAEAFKDYDLASKIGEVMQNAVVEDIGRWETAGVAFGHVSINAAPAEFLRNDYAERLLARLAEGRVDPGLIEVEVTEHVFLGRAADHVRRALLKLSAAGVRISLDDFGTGYSSLSHLKDFPVDALKIDRSFVQNMDAGGEAAAIVTALVDLARNLAIDVIAEGIETERQKQLLVERGCPYAQGFLFGEAAPADCVPHLARLTQAGGSGRT